MARKKTYTPEELTKIGNRIAKIRTDFCDENNTSFAQSLGIAKQTASNLVNGDKYPGKKTIRRILDAFPDVSERWLTLGEGPMLNRDVNITGDGDILTNGSSKVVGESSAISELAQANLINARTINDLTDRIGKLIDYITNK